MTVVSSDNIVRVAAVQSEPGWYHLEESTVKTIDLIKAASGGAKLVVFPELWICGYSFFLWTKPFAECVADIENYHANSLRINSEEMQRIRRACKEHSIWVSLGFSERDVNSLYMSTCIIDDKGEVQHSRRKIQPTALERVLFGNGSGDSVRNVIDSPFGRLGTSQCWEHIQPLLKYHAYTLHEEIHCAHWPSVFPFKTTDHFGMSGEGAETLTRSYAIEGQTFAIMATTIVSEEGAKRAGLWDERERGIFSPIPSGGNSRIFGPDGRSLAEPLGPAEEGLLFADLDLNAILRAKMLVDGVGHYSRPDLLRVMVNDSINTPSHFHNGTSASAASPASRFDPLDLGKLVA